MAPARGADYVNAMAGFLSNLGAELGARRKRLRKAIGDGRASLLEYVLLLGVVLGVASPSFGPKHFVGAYAAPVLPVLLIAGYLVIEANRQTLIARGQAAEAVRPANDQRVLRFLIAVAVIGYLVFVWALLAPPPFELAPEEAPPGALEVTIGP